MRVLEVEVGGENGGGKGEDEAGEDADEGCDAEL